MEDLPRQRDRLASTKSCRQDHASTAEREDGRRSDEALGSQIPTLQHVRGARVNRRLERNRLEQTGRIAAKPTRVVVTQLLHFKSQLGFAHSIELIHGGVCARDWSTSEGT